jgi:hypothetical protein
MLKICTLALLSVLALTACGDSDNPSSSSAVVTPAPTLTYSAEVRRTEYGIPHVKADDWGSLGYGFGYAYAQDNFCVVMREIIITTGRSAEAFGEVEGSTNSDFLLRFINGDKAEFKEQFFDQLPQYARDLSEGYVAGLNRYLDENNVYPICLLAPTSTSARREVVARQARGYLYYVSFKGITGADRLDQAEIAAPLAEIRSHTELPIAVGFGIKDPASAAAVARFADAVVIGSALISTLAGSASGEEAGRAAVQFLAPVRKAMDNGIS